MSGQSNPCVFYHSERGIRVLVHADDYASAGPLQSLKWMKESLEGRFQMKTAIIGHSADSDVVREGKILNRIIRASRRGWEYECDQRHVEVLVQELELEGAGSLSAPGIDEPVDKDEDSEAAPDPDAAASCRALACHQRVVSRYGESGRRIVVPAL